MFDYFSPRKGGEGFSHDKGGDMTKNFREWDDSYRKSKIGKRI